MYFRILYLTVLFFLIFERACHAQLDNSTFKDSISLRPDDARKLFLDVRVLGFVKDNEYTNEILTGNTLFGYQALPTLHYQPSSKVSLQAGAFLWKDFGNDKFSKLAPVFSLKYKSDSLTLIFGTLQGHLNHRLIEPLYNFERLITSRLESGFQAIYHKRKFYGDAWVDWQRAIYDTSTTQEQISAGFSGSYQLYSNTRFKVSVPLQMQVFHRGGNIGYNVTANTTAFNQAAGISFTHPVYTNGFVKSFRLDNYVVLYENASQVGAVPAAVFKKGMGVYFNLLLKTRWMDVMASYWAGDDYRSFQGGDLYQSVYLPPVLRPAAVENPSKNPRLPVQKQPTSPQPVIQPVRELLILRLMKDLNLSDNLFLTLRCEPHYDLISKQMEFSLGIYFNFHERFFLWEKNR